MLLGRASGGSGLLRDASPGRKEHVRHSVAEDAENDKCLGRLGQRGVNHRWPEEVVRRLNDREEPWGSLCDGERNAQLEKCSRDEAPALLLSSDGSHDGGGRQENWHNKGAQVERDAERVFSRLGRQSYPRHERRYCKLQNGKGLASNSQSSAPPIHVTHESTSAIDTASSEDRSFEFS